MSYPARIHVGITCPPAIGHLNPMMALGQELKQRGHRVTFLQVLDFENPIRASGCDFYAIAPSDYPPGTSANFFANLRNLREPAATRYWFEEQQRVAAIFCRDLPVAIQNLGIDALIVDQNEPAGATVAEYLGLPFVSVSNGLMMQREPDIPPVFTLWSYEKTQWARLRNRMVHGCVNALSRPYSQVLAAYRRKWKLPPLPQGEILYANSKLAQISQQPSVFDFPRSQLPRHFHYVGPLRSPHPQPYSQICSFPFSQLTKQPLIYASLGSLMQNQQVFTCIAAACEGLKAQLVLTHGGSLSDKEAAALPGSPLTVSYAPQRELLARATLTITHAGLNTVLDSLTYGVPMVAVPIAFEQPGIAARIRWTGVGEVIPGDRLSVRGLRSAIQQVLTLRSYGQKALLAKAAIAASGGVTRAADIVEQAIWTGEPVINQSIFNQQTISLESVG
ncbi:glycosyltransferase [Oscillatoria sp. FACHB-1407]|uniref:glycosyltransferase n=1 Tax=Oscillatoria sp. FACHB-1407 TaxID=2692847 RepID=UPI0016861476|nr:glycosyltransferase [Oscillatoria sp. FACHB-1407]MBD2463099.1 glycosyltransferase [Oscillatoria sp. FACHB-1407]